MRDALLREFLCSLIYRKCLLWKDLNIASEGYVHAEKKKITKAIEDYITNKKYAPTRPLFPSVGFDVRGRWALAKNEIQQQTSLGEFLKLLNWEMEDVFGIVRNYSNLN